MTDPISVIVVDDQPDMRMLVRAVLLDAGGFTVVEEAADGGEAIEATRHHLPQAVVLDVSMPDVDGIEALRTIRSEFPDLPVLMFSSLDDPDVIDAAMAFGATDYVRKHESHLLPDRIMRAIGVVS
jgi:DNA-binding NarL/FixJ family response regulator